MSVGTHIQHCCYSHGCKYGNNDCPVAWGTEKQDHRCEYCDMDFEAEGSPKCSATGCEQPGYWKWRGIANGTNIALVGLKVYYYFCDGHDKWHRKTEQSFTGQPVEKRIL